MHCETAFLLFILSFYMCYTSLVNLFTFCMQISRSVSKKLCKEKYNMVFSEEVTSDDEVWVTQAPKTVSILL